MEEQRQQDARTSLIPETLRGLEQDTEQQALAQRLQEEGQAALSREERRKRQRSLDTIGAPSFSAVLRVTVVQPCMGQACMTCQVFDACLLSVSTVCRLLIRVSVPPCSLLHSFYEV